MSSGDAKTYLSKRNVPALFECLMTGLMFHRPTDHIQYLIECLEKVKVKGQEEMRWNMFIEMQRSKTPLPPITPTNGRRPISRERSMTPKKLPQANEAVSNSEEEAVPEQRTPTPLPPIGSIPDVPIIFITGGPGCGSSMQAQLLQKKYPGWVLVAVGELLRQEVSDRGTANTKWKMVNDLMSDGEMVPEDVVDTLLLTRLKSSPNAEGFIIQGFPRDMEQAEQFDKLVGPLDAVFLIDCEQESLSQKLLARAKNSRRIDNNVNTIAKRIQAFRDKTLPVLKHYEDKEKLFVLEGEKKEEEIAEDLALVFETVMGGKGKLSPAPPKEPKPERVKSAGSGRRTPKKVSSPEPPSPPTPEPEDDAPLSAHLLPPEVKIKDEGRKPAMPTAPIIFVAGGPGSGKGTQCKRLLSRYTSAVHLSMGDIIRTKISTEGSADQKWGMVTDLLRQGDLAPEEVTVELLTNALKSQPEAHFYLVEGFPRNLEQLEDFNKQIGGQSFTILLDCEESILHYRLSMRGKNSERIDDNLTAIGKKLTFFKNTTLPILKSIDDSGKLVQVNGDRDEDEIHFDLCTVLDFAIYGTLPELSGALETKEPVVEKAIEAAIVAASATTTGDNVTNPSYSAELDATAEAKKTAEDTKTTEAPAAKENAESTKDAPTAGATAEKPPEASDKAEEDAGKPEEPAKTDDTPKQETAAADDAAKSGENPQEEASKSAEAAPSEEASKTEAEASKTQVEASKTEVKAVKTEVEAAKTEEPKSEEAAPKNDEAPKEETKPDELPKTEESPQTKEALKAEESAASGEASASEQKPSAELAAEEEKGEGEAASSHAAKESKGETDQAA